MASVASPASAQDPPSLFRPEWGEFSTAEGIVTGLGISSAWLFLFVLPDHMEADWEGGILFDDAVQDALRLDTIAGRGRAAFFSDVLFYSLFAYPFLDASLVAHELRDDGDLAVQLALINLESFAVTYFVTHLMKSLTRRERPLAWGCDLNDKYSPSCLQHDRYVSFPSGHSSMSFTGAMLTCTHHAFVPLYGGVWDGLACGVSLAAAATVGILRMASDNHYFSDVFVGATIGMLSGFLLPYLLHYRGGHDVAEPNGAALRARPEREFLFPLWTMPASL